MTTLGTLKARLARDLDDSAGAYESDIADAITRGIEFYQPHRFYFNETRDETFATVEDQQIYSSSDDTAIPQFYDLDQVTILVSGQVRELERTPPEIIEYLSDNSASKGEPFAYSYFNQSLRLYPIPDQAYTVRMIGHIKKAEPASDAEANNVWMTEAYQLIRYAARRYLAEDVMDYAEEGARMERNERRELNRLMEATSAKLGSGAVVPTQF